MTNTSVKHYYAILSASSKFFVTLFTLEYLSAHSLWPSTFMQKTTTAVTLGASCTYGTSETCACYTIVEKGDSCSSQTVWCKVNAGLQCLWVDGMTSCNDNTSACLCYEIKY